MTSAEPPVASPDRAGADPLLTDAQIAALAGHGERRATQEGETLIKEGEVGYPLLVVLSGSVVVLEHDGGRDQAIGVHGPGGFVGEIGVLTGAAAFFSAVAREAGEVLVVAPDRLKPLVARDSGLGDVLVHALLARRSLLIGARAGVRIVGSRFSPETRRLLAFVARNRLPHDWIDVEQDEDAEALLQELGVRPDETPVVIWDHENVLRNPSNAELARALGLPVPDPGDSVADVVVVGAGPAGLAASVYAASEGLSTVLLDGVSAGGQAATSPRIENYLGFPSGISGAELVERGAIQAEKFGAQLAVPAEVAALGEDGGLHVVTLEDGSTLRSRAVVIATGVRYRRLDVPGLGRFEETSVYHAATEIEARMCAGEPVAVVGGGNSAGQAALFLARRSTVVHLLVRGDSLEDSMSRYLIDQVDHDPAVQLHLHTEVRELRGERALEELVVEDNRTGERQTLDAHAMFVFIGAAPFTAWLGDELALDDRGYVLTGQAAGADAGVLETSRPGIYAAGDVRSGSVKRLTAAVGEGAMVVRLIFEHRGTAAESRPARQRPSPRADD